MRGKRKAGVGSGRRQVKLPGLGKSRRPAIVQPSYRSQLNATGGTCCYIVVLPCHDTLVTNNAQTNKLNLCNELATRHEIIY